MLTLTDDQWGEVAFMVRRMLYPSPLMRWMSGLGGAERNGTIKRSKQSVLRFGIARFMLSELRKIPIIPPDTSFTIRVMDDHVRIGLTTDLQTGCGGLEVHYPDWLLDFLEEDDNFDLLLPESTATLQDVLRLVHEWCWKHPPYDLLVSRA